jgi:TRAP-type C4-dicarboxylate transport system permease large subunit
MAGLLLNLDIPRIFIMLGILGIMFLLGMIMVPVGIYALTLPVVFPLVVRLGYDPIWFGVIALKLTEIGAITPPVGLNVYAMKGVIRLNITYRRGHIQRCVAFCVLRHNRADGALYISADRYMASKLTVGIIPLANVG